MAPVSSQHKFTFPPFPRAPGGVSIITFKDFKESGIKIQPDDYEGPEVDAFDIPTVVIDQKHAGDFCKTNSRRMAHVATPSGVDRNNGATLNLPLQRTWMQQWEDLSTRKSGERYNQNENRADRIHHATRAFNTSRPWPQKEKDVREQWDQFQLYIGILSIIPIWRLKQEPEGGDDDIADDFDDVEDILPQNPLVGKTYEPNKTTSNVEMSTERGKRSFHQKKKSRPRPPYENYDKPPVEVNGQEEIDQLIEKSRFGKVDRLNDFLNDPKGSIQIYLSSYMRKQGFHFANRNLTLLPRLIRFYLKFLIKDGVFSVESESETIASLNETLIILDIAEYELPLTSQIAKRLPGNDLFSGGCEELFDIVSKEQEISAQAWAQKNRKRLLDAERVEVSSTAAATIASTPVPEEAEPLDLDTDVVTPTVEQKSDMLETLVQSKNIVEQLPMESNTSFPVISPASVSNQGTAPNNLEHFGANEPGAWNSWLEDDSDNASAAWGAMGLDGVTDWGGGDVCTWDLPPPPTLLPILGPTAFPLTHTSGIVEWSMRRIQSIVHPNEDSDSSAAIASKLSGDITPAEAVEEDLYSRLSKIVLAPWLDWETPGEEDDTTLPQIKGSSRGRVVVYEKGQGVVYEYDSDVRSNAFAVLASHSNASNHVSDNVPPLLAHDPLKHSIILLVEPETAKLLRVGMGMGATWVQIARLTDLKSEQEVTEIEPDDAESQAISMNVDMDTSSTQASGRVSGGSGDSAIGARFWYLSNLLIVLPSYHIAAS